MNKGFFPLDITITNEIIEHMGWQEAMAYITLARYTHKSTNHTESSAGINAIEKKCGVSRTTAKRVLKNIKDASYIVELESDSPKQPKYKIIRSTAIKAESDTVNDQTSSNEERLIYLPNVLVDGLRKGSCPLARLQQKIKKCKGELQSSTVKDALSLLLHLYEKNNCIDYSGIDPRAAIFSKWKHNKHEPEKLPEGDYALYNIESDRDDNSCLPMYASNPSFIDEVLWYAEHNNRLDRFWHSVHQLKALKFIYEAITIWDADPIETNEASYLYTLYVFNSATADPQLQPYYHKRLSEMGCGLTLDKQPGISGSYTFRYISDEKLHAIGIFRLLYKACTKDTARWFAQELSTHRRLTQPKCESADEHDSDFADFLAEEARQEGCHQHTDNSQKDTWGDPPF